MTATPTSQHMRVLANIRDGRNEIDGFVIEENGVRAFFECVLNGWADRGELTSAGRRLLEEQA